MRSGFSLVEILVSLVILAILMAFTLPTIVTFTEINNDTERRAGAVSAAASAMDEMRATPFDTWQESSTRTLTVGDYTYQASITTCDAVCEPNLRSVVIEVRNAGVLLYTLDTVYFETGEI